MYKNQQYLAYQILIYGIRISKIQRIISTISNKDHNQYQFF